MSDKSNKFSLFRKKDDEELKEAEERIEELEDKLHKKELEESVKKNAAKMRAQKEKMEEAAAKKQVKKHTVASGETLSGIAKKYYDDAGKYMKIYEANKDVIGGDPSLIQPGMELVIPDL